MVEGRLDEWYDFGDDSGDVVVVDGAGRLAGWQGVTSVLWLVGILRFIASEGFFVCSQEVTLLLSTSWFNNEISLSWMVWVFGALTIGNEKDMFFQNL